MRLISFAQKIDEEGDAAVNIQQGESLVGARVLYVSIYPYSKGKRESNPFCLHTEVAGLNMCERELPVANANDPSGLNTHTHTVSRIDQEALSLCEQMARAISDDRGAAGWSCRHSSKYIVIAKRVYFIFAFLKV